jgi:hypothetical protein
VPKTLIPSIGWTVAFDRFDELLEKLEADNA